MEDACMSNITMKLDDEIIKKVRKIAIEKNTTLTGLVRDYLTHLARQEEQRTEEIIAELSGIMNSGEVRMGEKSWSREDIHER
jgi:predicted transcriptional regulator